jgi:hypothetical protein
VDAEIVTCFDLIADVDFGGRVVADQDHGEPWRAGFGCKGLDTGLQLSFDFIADAISIEDTGHSH